MCRSTHLARDAEQVAEWLAMKLAITFLMLSLSAYSQAAKRTASELSTFAKAGLKTMIVMEDFEGTSLSGKAQEAMQDARAAYNPKNPSEARMFSNLTLFAMVRQINNLQRQAYGQSDALDEKERQCYEPIESAFRERRSIPTPPACKKSNP